MQDKSRTDSGAKAHQGTEQEDRTKEYMLWHRSLDRSLVMLDVDAIEWRFRDGIKDPVGLFQITRVDIEKEVHASYLDAIIARFFEREFQSQAADTVANKFGMPAYITLFKQGCSEFCVYCLSEGSVGSWTHYATPAAYETFLGGR